MMYVHEPSLVQLKKDLAATFVVKLKVMILRVQSDYVPRLTSPPGGGDSFLRFNETVATSRRTNEASHHLSSC